MKARYLHIFIAVTIMFPASALANDDLECAMEAYQRSHYAESVELLRPAAESGNVRAQEMLGLMHLYGANLYGDEVPRDLDQARYWLRRAAAAGSAVAAHELQATKWQSPGAETSTGVRPRSE